MSSPENKKSLFDVPDQTDEELNNELDFIANIISGENQKRQANAAQMPEIAIYSFTAEQIRKHTMVLENTSKLINFLIDPTGWNAKVKKTGKPICVLDFLRWKQVVFQSGHMVKEFNPKTGKCDRIKKVQKVVKINITITDKDGKPVFFELIDRQILMAADNISKYTENFAGVERSFFRAQDVLKFFNRKNGYHPNEAELIRQINERIDYLKDCNVRISLSGDIDDMKTHDPELINSIRSGYNEKLLPILRSKEEEVYLINGKKVQGRVWALESEPILIRIAKSQGHAYPYDRDILQLSKDYERNEIDYRLRYRYDHDDRGGNKDKEGTTKNKILVSTIAKHLGTFKQYRSDWQYRKNLIRKVESTLKRHQKEGMISGYRRLKDNRNKFIDEFQYYPLGTEQQTESE